MKFRPTVLELLVVVGVVGILCGLLLPLPHHHLHPVAEQEMFGYWVSIPSTHSAYRLLLTNHASGMLGVRDIYTDLWSVASWQVTNRDICIDLAPVTHPEWGHEYIRGKIGVCKIVGVRGGTNQSGERWKREMTFYREDMVREDLAAASAVMTNLPQIIEPYGAANRSQPDRSGTNSTSAAAGSGR